ncbi:DNA repair protein swi5 sae3 [Phlyctema vagabunda]|uniref:DNA repair protein swi5 sae3 n=1 Tax=Phlyctema vagabunda TaxID=108571 RepID=A0ABR4PN38_9HELO
MTNDTAFSESREDQTTLPVLSKEGAATNGIMRQEVPDSEDPVSEEGSVRDTETSSARPAELLSARSLSPSDHSKGDYGSLEEPCNPATECVTANGGAQDPRGPKAISNDEDALDSATVLEFGEMQDVPRQPDQELKKTIDYPTDHTASAPELEAAGSERQVIEDALQPSIGNSLETDASITKNNLSDYSPSHLFIDKAIPDSDDTGSSSTSHASVHGSEEMDSELLNENTSTPLNEALSLSDNHSQGATEIGAGSIVTDELKVMVGQKNTGGESSPEGGDSIRKVVVAGKSPDGSRIGISTGNSPPSKEQEPAQSSEVSDSRTSRTKLSGEKIIDDTGGLPRSNASVDQWLPSHTAAAVQPRWSSSQNRDNESKKAVEKINVKEETLIIKHDILSSSTSAQKKLLYTADRPYASNDISSSSPRHDEPALEQDEDIDMMYTPTSSPPFVNDTAVCGTHRNQEASQTSHVLITPVSTMENSMTLLQTVKSDEDFVENELPGLPLSGTKPPNALEESVETTTASARSLEQEPKVGEKRSIHRSSSHPTPPNKDVLFTELKSIKIASIQAQNTALQTEIDAKRAKLEEMKNGLRHPAAETVKNHIKLLHDYNDIRDVGQGLVGMIAENRGVRIGELYDEFGVGLKD